MDNIDHKIALLLPTPENFKSWELPNENQLLEAIKSNEPIEVDLTKFCIRLSESIHAMKNAHRAMGIIMSSIADLNNAEILIAEMQINGWKTKEEIGLTYFYQQAA